LEGFVADKTILDQAREAIEQWERATPGPWSIKREDETFETPDGCEPHEQDGEWCATSWLIMGGDPGSDDEMVLQLCETMAERVEPAEANVRVIAAARTREPALAAAVLELHRILERLLGKATHWDEDERVAAVEHAARRLEALINPP
jgi:hypothetical protein